MHYSFQCAFIKCNSNLCLDVRFKHTYTDTNLMEINLLHTHPKTLEFMYTPLNYTHWIPFEHSQWGRAEVWPWDAAAKLRSSDTNQHLNSEPQGSPRPWSHIWQWEFSCCFLCSEKSQHKVPWEVGTPPLPHHSRGPRGQESRTQSQEMLPELPEPSEASEMHIREKLLHAANQRLEKIWYIEMCFLSEQKISSSLVPSPHLASKFKQEV